MLKRPPNPATVDYNAPGVPCWEDHTADISCELCCPLDDVECEEDESYPDSGERNHGEPFDDVGMGEEDGSG
jgi:hypothetical protein